MHSAAIINKKSVQSALALKQAQKEAKRKYGKASGKPLKNYLGKVVSPPPLEPVLEELQVSDFSAGFSIETNKIVRAKDNNERFDIAAYNLSRCIQCGSCTYFCPASKDVAAYMKE